MPWATPRNQPPWLWKVTGISRSSSAASAGVVIDTLPNSATSEMSMKRTSASPFSSSVILSVSPSLPIRACCDCTTSGSASSGGTAIVRGAREEPESARTSSGRQTVTSAQRGHFGLSLSGGGMRLCETVRRNSLTAVRAAMRRESSSAIRTRSLLDAVAMLFQKQRLEADLDALRLVGALRHMRALAPLVIDGRDDAVLRLGDVELGDDAERCRGERQRAADGLAGLRRFIAFASLRRWQRRIGLVDACVNAAALDSIARLRPLALRPHQVGEPRAIRELVHHPRGDERGVAADRRRGKVKFELGVSHCGCYPNLRLTPLLRTARRRNAGRGPRSRGQLSRCER